MNEYQGDRIVAFLTDFGLRDSYVAEMHAVLLSRCQKLRILDLSHGLSPGDVHSGAYILGRVAEYLPAGTIFVAVIDPGVGTDRQAVLIRCRQQYFIGPDNGIFSRIIHADAEPAVRILDWRDAGCNHGSNSFHGRDLFTPVAAKIINGINFDKLGEPGMLKVALPIHEPIKTENGLLGEVVYIDEFGNVITNLPDGLNGTVEIAGRFGIAFANNYLESKSGELFWINGSGGNLEISLCRASAAKMLTVKIGDRVKFSVTKI